MPKHALVVPRTVLFAGKQFQGFLPLTAHDYVRTILATHTYHPRGDELESNHALQQIIPYVWIIRPRTGQVFMYRRVPNESDKQSKEFLEQRYMGKVSGGVGGHIDKETEQGQQDALTAAMMREIREEVTIRGAINAPQFVGYINDDSDEIGKVHFGLVALLEVEGDVTIQEGQGLAEARFYTHAEVDAMFNDAILKVENWTRLSWPFIKATLETRHSSNN